VRRQAIVAFGVNGIVTAPVGDWGNRNARFELVRMGHRIQRHGAAIAPSPNGCAAAIQLRILREKLIESAELILEFDSTELVTYRRLELSVAPRSATIIHPEDRESLPRQHLVKKFLFRPFIVHC